MARMNLRPIEPKPDINKKEKNNQTKNFLYPKPNRQSSTSSRPDPIQKENPEHKVNELRDGFGKNPNLEVFFFSEQRSVL